MQHSFDIEVAKKYGVHCAVLLNNIYFWIEKNRANNINFQDNNYWVYCSKKAFSELFPYMTQRQIDYALKKLIDDGILITGNYNKLCYDKTLWYALTKKGYSILQNCEIGDTELYFDIAQNCELTTNKNVQPIPDIKKDIKKDIKEDIKRESYKSIISTYTENTALLDALDGYVEMRKKVKGFTTRALNLALNKLDKLATTDEEKIAIVNETVMNSWKSFYPLKDKQYPQQQKTKKGDGSEYAEFDL